MCCSIAKFWELHIGVGFLLYFDGCWDSDIWIVSFCVSVLTNRMKQKKQDKGLQRGTEIVNGTVSFNKCKQLFEYQHLLLLRDIWWWKFFLYI
jgi:hypothetical protein